MKLISQSSETISGKYKEGFVTYSWEFTIPIKQLDNLIYLNPYLNIAVFPTQKVTLNSSVYNNNKNIVLACQSYEKIVAANNDAIKNYFGVSIL